VLASRGSVIPLFHDQIRNGGPVTITVPGMTRFLLSLDQAVDTVFTALREAAPGETYVPNAPSATVENIARALIGRRAIETKVTGIRPGEKMHEIMVSEEEAHHCVRRGDYYAILPMLPELAARNEEKRPEKRSEKARALEREFSSADNVLDLKGTEALLKRHRLMPDDVKQAELGELLR
ncbi:MAG: polysaccharide biosynthesis protein, partial [Betaproteobacteria bacterium]